MYRGILSYHVDIIKIIGFDFMIDSQPEDFPVGSCTVSMINKDRNITGTIYIPE